MTASGGHADARALPGPGDTNAEACAAVVRGRTSVRPRVAVVLGSGLGDVVAADVRSEAEFGFEELPGFPPWSIRGHAGRLVIGDLYGATTAVFRGRVHYYQGHGMASATLIPRLAAMLGVDTIILTNSAGGLDRSMRVGQLMLIEDHVNFMGVNPLTGWTFPGGEPAFVDLAAVYDRTLRGLAREAAVEARVDVAHGVYAGLPGPSYETPAETAFLRGAGADAVGMSTVPEAVAAAALGLRVLGISVISNVAGTEASHDDVLATARNAAANLRSILGSVIPKIARMHQDAAAEGKPASMPAGHQTES